MKFAGKALTGIFMRCMWDEADVDVIQKQQVVTAKRRMCLPKEMYDLCGNWFMAVQKTMWKRKATVRTVPYYCTSTFQAVTWKNAPIWKTKKTAGCGIDRWSARQRKDQLILHWELLLNLNSTKHCERPPPGIVKLFHYGVQIFVRLLPADCFLIQLVFRHIKNFVLVMKCTAHSKNVAQRRFGTLNCKSWRGGYSVQEKKESSRLRRHDPTSRLPIYSNSLLRVNVWFAVRAVLGELGQPVQMFAQCYHQSHPDRIRHVWYLQI